jgi:hypothetical protein
MSGRRPSTSLLLDPASLSVSTTMTSLAASTPGTPASGLQAAVSGPPLTAPAVSPTGRGQLEPTGRPLASRVQLNVKKGGYQGQMEKFPDPARPIFQDPAPVHGIQESPAQQQRRVPAHREDFQVGTTLLEMLNKFRKYTIVIWVQPKHTLTFP